GRRERALVPRLLCRLHGGARRPRHDEHPVDGCDRDRDLRGEGALSFRIRGSYFESCNCEAICPCRMIGGVPGGRSTYGVCHGVLSWAIEDGSVDAVDVSGL